MREISVTKKFGEVVGLTNVSDAFASLRNGDYVVTIRRKAEKRSISQNRIMWAWFQCIYEETKTLPQDIHDYYCEKFLSRIVWFKGEAKHVTSGTSRLTKDEMTNFLNLIQADAASELGMTLPTPEDRAFQMFFELFGDKNGER